jgi:hypothetical protein
MLTEHIGDPNVIQRALISRAPRVALHLEIMDEHSLIDGHVFGPHDHNFYVSWTNALARLLVRLGVDKSLAGDRPIDLADFYEGQLTRRQAAPDAAE